MMDESEDDTDRDEPDFDLPPPELSSEEFLQWRSPRYGNSNPSEMSNPLWNWLVQSKLDAYNANNRFKGPDSFSAGPMWCFHRFGMSRTPLPDGRVVHIAGEHEDHYDPDFHIYNDVIVRHPNGDVQVYGYPKEVFPPTDFHTATLADQSIVVIGSLGYPESRQPSVTPVAVLDLSTFEMRQVPTDGVSPGWISNHSAEYKPEERHIVIRNGKRHCGDDKPARLNVDEWVLDINAWTWSRRTKQEWTQWWLVRKDRRRNHLWDVRQLAWYESVGWQKELAEQGAKLIDQLGALPDLALLGSLYRPWSGIELLPEEEDSFGIHTVKADTFELRIDEHDGFGITILVKGSLAAGLWDTWMQSTLTSLHLLEGQPWEAIQLETS